MAGPGQVPGRIRSTAHYRQANDLIFWYAGAFFRNPKRQSVALMLTSNPRSSGAPAAASPTARGPRSRPARPTGRQLRRHRRSHRTTQGLAGFVGGPPPPALSARSASSIALAGPPLSKAMRWMAPRYRLCGRRQIVNMTVKIYQRLTLKRRDRRIAGFHQT